MTTRIAIVGSGISGLSAAHVLKKHPKIEVSLYEANDYYGGHTHTVNVQAQTHSGVQSYPVDTGFLVFNERTYPKLIALFKELNIPTALSEMSFSVQAPKNESELIEWSGSSINSVFAQRKNLFNLDFLSMLKDILRFNSLTTSLALSEKNDALNTPLIEFLREHKFNSFFIHWYLLPMLGCIWSCPPDQMLAFPVSTMIRFCHNHGLLQVSNRPRWYTVAGGAKQYVDIITSSITHKYLNTPVLNIERAGETVYVDSARGRDEFKHVIIASHADQALKMLRNPTDLEKNLLGAFKFKDNTAILHTDHKVLPCKKLAWAAWNFESNTSHTKDLNTQDSHSKISTLPSVCLHYYLNKLQPLPFVEPVIVSLNPIREIDSSKISAVFNYTHPIFDLGTNRAQEQMVNIQGKQNTWFAGAWMSYGFHEDGHKAGDAVANSLLKHLEQEGTLS
jgi:predicted NAD/FAD-binding protein